MGTSTCHRQIFHDMARMSRLKGVFCFVVGIDSTWALNFKRGSKVTPSLRGVLSLCIRELSRVSGGWVLDFEN